MQLANRGFPLRAMGDSVDHESTGTAYTFAAVVVERNGVFPLGDKIIVEHIEHFKKRHVRIHFCVLVAHETARMTCRFLAPDVEN